MGVPNLFHKPTKKEEKTKQVKNNSEQGKSGEQLVVSRWQLNGWKMTRTGTGHDYRATRINRHTGKLQTYFVEIKTGNSTLSERQKEAKKRYGTRYVVERVQVNLFMGHRGNNLTGPSKSSKKKSKGSSNVEWLSGGNSSKSSRSSNVKKLIGSGSGKNFKW